MTGDVKIVLPRIPRREGEQPFAEQGGDGVANVALVARVGDVVRDGDLPPWNESSYCDSLDLFLEGIKWARSGALRSRLLGSFVRSRFWSVRGTRYLWPAARRGSAKPPIIVDGVSTAD